jgi:hypothetical protein
MPFASPGDRLSIPATVWNDLQAMLSEWKAGKLGGARAQPAASGLPVLIQNMASWDVNEFGVLGISDIVIDITQTTSEKFNGIRVVGIPPETASLPTGKYAVLQEPAAANGGFARAVIVGVTLVRLNITHAADWACGVTQGVTEGLTTNPVGSSRILLKSLGTGSSDKWGVIRVGDHVTHFFGKPAGSISAGSSGTCNVWDGAFAGALGNSVPGCNNPSTANLTSSDKVFGIVTNGVVTIGKIC